MDLNTSSLAAGASSRHGCSSQFFTATTVEETDDKGTTAQGAAAGAHMASSAA